MDLLGKAARAMGVDHTHIGSRSLRIGGATATCHAVPDLERLKRFGRWKSNAFHAYLWEAHEPQKGLAEAMSARDYQLTAGSAAPRYRERESSLGGKVRFTASPPEER